MNVRPEKPVWMSQEQYDKQYGSPNETIVKKPTPKSAEEEQSKVEEVEQEGDDEKKRAREACFQNSKA